MTSGDETGSDSSGSPEFQLGMGSVPTPETPDRLNDTVFLTNDGTPGSGTVDFVLNLNLETPPLPNRFCVEKMLGQGGFGCVYLATDEVLSRVVAIKIPYRTSDKNGELRTQFLKESRAAARLNHPSIVRVLDSGESDGIFWQVAEYVDGPRLSDFRVEQGGTLPPIIAARIVSHLADAVQHAHDNGVLHRDIKPENILLERILRQSDASEALETTIPRLTDFGLARLADDDIAASRSGIVVGTPKYMAPEQLQGKSSMQGEWTDIYSLGLVLYELLTGAIPFPEAVDLNARIAVSNKSVPSF
jgi:serine/threonine protein kinase